MVNMFWLSRTADYFETDYHWQQMLAIENNNDMNSYFWFIKTFPKSMTMEINTIKANTMVLDKKLFFNGFHSLENIFLLRNNLNVLKFKGY
jgi:hypothetical protein